MALQNQLSSKTHQSPSHLNTDESVRNNLVSTPMEVSNGISTTVALIIAEQKEKDKHRPNLIVHQLTKSNESMIYMNPLM